MLRGVAADVRPSKFAVCRSRRRMEQESLHVQAKEDVSQWDAS